MADSKNVKVIYGAKETYWQRIGVAFENKDGSLNLKFDYFPTNAEITIQVRDAKKE